MTLALLQARMSSNRLPGKVLRPILGEPMIGRQIERLRRSRRLSRIVVATSTEPEDAAIANCAASLGVDVFRGSLDDVLDRYRNALRAFGPIEHFVRLTADCPLADPALVDLCIERHMERQADYTHNSPGGTYPKGLDVEVCRTSVLETAWREAKSAYEREHVTPFVYGHPGRFRVEVVSQSPAQPYRWTVDTPEDFAFVSAVYAALYPRSPAFTSDDVLAWQAQHPDQVLMNTPHVAAPLP